MTQRKIEQAAKDIEALIEQETKEVAADFEEKVATDRQHLLTYFNRRMGDHNRLVMENVRKELQKLLDKTEE